MNELYYIQFSKKALKDLRKLPKHITINLQSWVDSVSHVGLRKTRQIPGYHDEPLVGKRKGQRSIRLSKSYRAIYHMLDNGELEFIEVLEVNKHEY